MVSVRVLLLLILWFRILMLIERFVLKLVDLSLSFASFLEKISWSSKRQYVVSSSSVEAEYRGVANVVTESAWLHNLLLKLHCPLSRSTVVLHYLASNPVQY